MAVVNPASGASWGLRMSNIRSISDLPLTDTPGYFYDFAGSVGIFPPYSAVTTETVTLYLAKLPAIITAGQTVLTPAIFDTALGYYMVGNALLVDRRYQEAGNYLNLHEREIDRYRQDFAGADYGTTDPIK